MRPLTALNVTPSPDNPRSQLPGWSGEPVEAWRVSSRVKFWHQLAVVGGRAILTKEDATFSDWIGAYIDLSKLRSSPEDFTKFWLYDVDRDALPRNWLRWAVNLVQSGFKVTAGNPVDEQHSAYLLDCDIFLSADTRYVSILEIVREDSPFGLAELRLVSGDRSIPVLDRFEAALLACYLTCAFTLCLEGEFSLRRFSHVVAWRQAGFFDPGCLPGPGLPGFGAPAGQRTFARMFRNPQRTRAGVSRPGGAGRSWGRRRSAAKRARRSWAWQAMISQVHRSAAAGSRIFWAVQPRTCLNSRNVCSRSNLRKNDCQHRSTSVGAAPVRDHHGGPGLVA